MKKSLAVLIFLPLIICRAYCETEKTISLDKKVLFSRYFKDNRLRQFSVHVNHQKSYFSFDNGYPTYISDMRAKISVHKPKDLKQFAIVQYIKGCIFMSKKQEGGTVELSINHSRKFFGNYKSFKHKDWEVDSNSDDPIYWAPGSKYPDAPRNGHYRLDRVNPSERAIAPKYFFKDHNQETSFYVSDQPSMAGFSGHESMGFQNVSMKFKTCLFEVKDVPRKLTDKSGKGLLKKAIKCFYWQNNFVYNFEKSIYENSYEIHPFCLK